jgi:ubiquinone/menaquinone biosynthesis C-methylase UbiE
MTPKECSKPCDLKDRTREKYDVQWKDQSDDAAAERRKSLSMVADPLIRMIQPLKGMTVADLGVGTGSLAFRAIELGEPGRMVGIDFSRTGLCLTRSISNGSKFRETEVELIQADLERIPLADKSVDAIISQATINLLPSKSQAMKEIARIARSGAKIAISDAFRTSQASCGQSWEQCIGGAVTVSEFSTLALDAGLLISNQADLTQQVRTLVNAKKWDWPEFVQHNMDYRVFLLLRA